MFPSKADRIMSRYRPIAPKPVAYGSIGITSNDPLVSSAASADNMVCRQTTTDSSKGKRSRKRRGDVLTSSYTVKKTAPASSGNTHSIQSNSLGGSALTDRSMHSSGVYGGMTDSEHFSSFGLPFPPSRVGRRDVLLRTARLSSERALFPFSGVGRRDISLGTARPSGDMSEGADCGRSDCCNSSGVLTSGSGLEGFRGSISSAKVLVKDAAFMERAAASAPPIVFPDRKDAGTRVKGSGCFDGAFTEMIRGITGLPTAADVQTLLQHRVTKDVRRSTTEVAVGAFSSGALPVSSSVYSSQCAGANEYDAGQVPRSVKLVTLPLLPEVPSASDSSFESSLSTPSSVAKVDLDISYDGGLAERQHPSGLSLLGDKDGVVPESPDHKVPLREQGYIERVYGASSDPVLLLDDSQRVLWMNRAYERAAKAAAERITGESASAGPYIDPLGSPIPFRSFELGNARQRKFVKATLWGFLKKFVVQEDDSLRQETGSAPAMSSFLKGPCDNNLVPAGSEEDAAEQYITAVSAGREESKRSAVVVPQPLRLVGSSVSLESVTDVDADAAPISGTIDIIQSQLEQGSVPAFITDSCKKVRWVNSSYKQMVGQPECPWLASDVGNNSGGSRWSSKMVEEEGCPNRSFPCPRLAGEVLLACNVEIPVGASAFSGRANIEWRSTGRRSSMTVPCDVYRVGIDVWLWKFDVASSLRLTCGV